MSAISIVGYHTCRNEGGYDHIFKNIPFLSRPGSHQWLTQGYYFWTDSPYWAEDWLRNHDNKVIGKFIATFDDKNELFDLVGNVEHQIEFTQLIDVVAEEMGVTNSLSLTVNQVISFFREHSKKPEFKGFFDYIAIRAADQKSVQSIKFIEPRIKRQGKTYFPKLHLVTRQQLCVFENGTNCLKFDGFHCPESFKEKFNESNK